MEKARRALAHTDSVVLVGLFDPWSSASLMPSLVIVRYYDQFHNVTVPFLVSLLPRITCHLRALIIEGGILSVRCR